MPQSVEVKGKSVDEAIFNGLNQLGLGLDEVEIEILEEGRKGLFGLGKSAVVRLTERTTPLVEVELPEWKPAQREETPAETRPEGRKHEERTAAQASAPKHPAKEQRRPREQHGPRRPKRERRQRPPEAAHEEPVVQTHEEERKTPGVLENLEGIPAAEQALNFLNGMFEVMHVEAKTDALDNSDAENVHLRITGKDTSILIGRRGDTLDSLQYLTGLVVNKGSDEYIRVMLDAENYRKRREQTLQNLAKRLATNVIRTGRPVRLEPMNPYERRILHAALQSNPKVETYSEGVDPNRRVVIRKKRPTRDRREQSEK